MWITALNSSLIVRAIIKTSTHIKNVTLKAIILFWITTIKQNILQKIVICRIKYSNKKGYIQNKYSANKGYVKDKTLFGFSNN